MFVFVFLATLVLEQLKKKKEHSVALESSDVSYLVVLCFSVSNQVFVACVL